MSDTDPPLPLPVGKAPPDPQRRLDNEVRHELRTQLNQIIGYSDLLIDEAEQRELNDLIPDLQKIHAAGLRLLDLINQHVDPINYRAANAPELSPTTE